MRSFFVVLSLVMAPAAMASFLREVPVKPHSDEVEVQQLRAKLTKVSGGFSKLLSGATGKTHVGSMMAKVEVEVQQVLKETEKPKDMKKALSRLQEANGAIKQLSVDMAEEQQDLTREGDEQQETKDMKTPLFKQIASYLDAHAPKKAPEVQIPDKLKAGKDGKPDVTPIVLALEARVHKMETSERQMEEHHDEANAALDRAALEKKNNTRLAKQITHMKKKDDRDFAKQAAMAKHDIVALKAAIESVKKGDMAGLQKAQDALDKSMKAAQARSGKVLYFIQLVQRTEGQDCPFCVAQCVGKCHDAGKPYVGCMTDCAESGK